MVNVGLNDGVPVVEELVLVLMDGVPLLDVEVLLLVE